MNTLTIRDTSGLASIRQAWESLRSHADYRAPNADPDRYLALLGTLDGAQPHVFTCQTDARPRAVLVGKTDNRRMRCRFGRWQLGSPKVRVLDIVRGGLMTDGTAEAELAVLEHIRGLLASGEADAVVIHHVPAHSRIACELTRTLRPAVRRSILNWRLPLTPREPDVTIAKLWSAAHRKERRREERLLSNHLAGAMELRRFRSLEDVGEYVEATAALAARTWQAKVGTGTVFADTQLWRTILSVEARQGRLLCYWLAGHGKPIAYGVGYVYGKTYYWEATGYDTEYAKFSPGQMLLGKMVRDLCLLDVEEIDLGLGDQEYKRRFATHSVELLTLHLYGLRAAARIASALDFCGEGITNAVAGVLERTRLGHRLRRTSRRDD